LLKIYQSGTLIKGTSRHNKDVIREIVDFVVEGQFYLWKYPDHDEIFDSQGSDPLLELDWVVVNA
jgi:hypothetical protein